MQINRAAYESTENSFCIHELFLVQTFCEWQLKMLVPGDFQFLGCIDYRPTFTQLPDFQLMTNASLEYNPVQHQREMHFFEPL